MFSYSMRTNRAPLAYRYIVNIQVQCSSCLVLLVAVFETEIAIGVEHQQCSVAAAPVIAAVCSVSFQQLEFSTLL